MIWTSLRAAHTVKIMGLGQQQLGQLGRGHQRPCGGPGERLRLLADLRRGAEILPAQLRPLVPQHARPDDDDLAGAPEGRRADVGNQLGMFKGLQLRAAAPFPFHVR